METELLVTLIVMALGILAGLGVWTVLLVLWGVKQFKRFRYNAKHRPCGSP